MAFTGLDDELAAFVEQVRALAMLATPDGLSYFR